MLEKGGFAVNSLILHSTFYLRYNILDSWASKYWRKELVDPMLGSKKLEVKCSIVF